MLVLFVNLNLKKNNGSYSVIATPAQEFSYSAYRKYYGKWFCVYARPYAIPTGATHARVFAEYRDEVRIWSGPSIANWGNILIDNVMVWQEKTALLRLAVNNCIYFPVLGKEKGELLPPFANRYAIYLLNGVHGFLQLKVLFEFH